MGVLCSNSIHAQDSIKQLKYETEYPQQHMLAFDSTHFLLIKKVGQDRSGKAEFEIGKYDTGFEEFWTTRAFLNKRLRYYGWSRSGKMIYLLFTSPFPDRSTMQVLGLHQYSGRMTKYDFQIEGFSVNCFAVVKDNVFVGGSAYKEGKLFMVDMKRHETRELLIPHTGKGRVEEIVVLPGNKIQAIMFNKVTAVSSALMVRRFTAMGKSDGGFTLSSVTGENLMYGSCLIEDDGTQYIMGNYGLPGDLWSQGYFFAMVREDKKEILKFYPFVEFADLAVEKAKEDEETGSLSKQEKRARKVRYDLLMHPLMSSRERFLLVGEVYTTRRRQRGDIVGHGARGRGGYKFSLGLIACFDVSGNMVFDRAINLYGQRRRELRKIIRVGVDDEAWSFSVPLGDEVDRHRISAWGEVLKVPDYEDPAIEDVIFMPDGRQLARYKGELEGSFKLKMIDKD